MINLLSAILCSTGIALILKHGEERNYNRYVILSMNYTMATLISLWLVLKGNLFESLQWISPGALAEQMTGNHFGAEGFLSAGNSALWALLIGIPTGVLYFLGFFYYQKSARECGVGMAGSYAKLGILIPMILSMLFWKEFPGGMQWVGIILALTAIAIVNLRFNSRSIFASLKPALLLLFLCSGVSEFTNKLYQRYGMLEMKDLFLFFLFGTALLISLLKTGKKPKWREVLAGFAVGIPNFLASFFLINALSEMPASVVFPSYSAGSIALICLGGRFLFTEKLSRREVTA
ncbi:MAG: EamA family transporter, partial [bacterium]|nr:EamA family transporter [bacterium]